MEQYRIEEAAHLVRSCAERGEIPGAVLLIGNRGKTRFHEAWGWAQLVPEKLPMTKDTLFDIASLTKIVGTWTGIAMLLLSRAYKKAKKRHPVLDQKIAAELDRLHAYERSDAPPSADEPATIFGELMRAVFAEELEGTSARLASEIGYHVGKWIYLTDAADDLEADRKHRRFNPYLRLFEGRMGEHERSNVRLALTAILCDAERAFLLMENAPCPEIHEILANILYLGLPDAADRALDPEPKKKQKKTEKELSDE